MRRPLVERAVDHAFIMHVRDLFETFNRDIKVQSTDGRGLDHARKQHAIAMGFARQTHREMMKHLATISDAEL